MPFTIRTYHRLIAGYPVTYERLFEDGKGTAWDLSPTGLRLCGTLPLAVGDVFSLKVKLPSRTRVSILAGIVRWKQDEYYGGLRSYY
jgi:PilZ domain